MQPIAIATLSVCIALLCLSQSESLSPLAQLEDPNLQDPAMSNSAVTFHNYVCRGCYQRGPGSRSSSFFCSYKAVTTHIGRSALCQTEGKGIYTVPVQYRPSGRAEDQEAGPVGAGGAWPVRPAAPAAAPGKHIVCCGRHIVCYDIEYDVVALYRMFLAMRATTSEPYVRYRIIPMLPCTSYATSSKNVRCRIRCRIKKWQEPV